MRQECVPQFRTNTKIPVFHWARPLRKSRLQKAAGGRAAVGAAALLCSATARKPFAGAARVTACAALLWFTKGPEETDRQRGRPLSSGPPPNDLGRSSAPALETALPVLLAAGGNHYYTHSRPMHCTQSPPSPAARGRPPHPVAPPAFARRAACRHCCWRWRRASEPLWMHHPSYKGAFCLPVKLAAREPLTASGSCGVIIST
ncbi:MAG: hypothetical protein J3K34DRAFT_446361, partial [Monoraphidium minutum]